MRIEEVKLTLENDSRFYAAYLACVNIQTGDGGRAGSSIGVQRRSTIGNWCGQLNFRTKMLDLVELERYFNERYDLCPYGLALNLKSSAAPTETPTQENDMDNIAKVSGCGSTDTTSSKPAVEQVTLVYGQDARKISDEQMYANIAALEAKMASLESLKNKPKKLLAQIAEMQKEINLLVEVVDSRE